MRDTRAGVEGVPTPGDNLLLNPAPRPIPGLLTSDDRSPSTGSTDSTVSTEQVSKPGPDHLIGRLVLVAVVIGLFVVFARSDDGKGDADEGSTAIAEFDGGTGTATPVEILEGQQRSSDVGGLGSNGVAVAQFRPWPDPPEDHDPHIAGRPGPQEPVLLAVDGLTLVYVNDRGRPTVLDLSTGDQREVDIAGSRERDRFLVELGRIVAMPGSDADLPRSVGRAFLFSAQRTIVASSASPAEQRDATNLNDLPLLSGPTLCLDEGGCPGAAMLSGTFGDDENLVTSLDGAESPSAAIGETLGTNWWRREGRWTYFSLDTRRETELRIPTPMTSTTVWIIKQTD